MNPELKKMIDSRLLDAEIAVKVMLLGWDVVYGDAYESGDYPRWIREENVPHYSTNMGDAWLVVEKLKQRPNVFVEFVDAVGTLCDALDYLYPNGVVYATIESISPLIICQAALEAIEIEVASHAIES